MRDAIARIKHRDHVALAYERTGLVRTATDPRDEARSRWLDERAGSPIAPGYAEFFAHRWLPTLTAGPSHRVLVLDLELESRLLIGHGNPSATEVGLTLHHTWSVPMIPGSAIKGVLAHHIVRNYGGGGGEEPERAGWRGVQYDQSRILAGPGEHYRRIFGAPDSLAEPRGACVGEVVFHDALYVPGSVDRDRPLARDVVTVHQVEYYRNEGKKKFPTDYDDPNPVGFLTVRPGAGFRVVIEGPAELLILLEPELRDALAESGVGGKTSLGYGRLRRPATKPVRTTEPPAAPARAAIDPASAQTLGEFEFELRECSGVPEKLDLFDAWRDRLGTMTSEDRRKLANKIEKLKAKKPDLLAKQAAFVAFLRSE